MIWGYPSFRKPPYVLIQTLSLSWRGSLQTILGMPSFPVETEVFRRDPKPLCALRPMLSWIFCTSWDMKTVRKPNEAKSLLRCDRVGSAAMIPDTRTNVQTNVSIQHSYSLHQYIPDRWLLRLISQSYLWKSHVRAQPRTMSTPFSACPRYNQTWMARSTMLVAQTGRQKLWAATGPNSSRQRVLLLHVDPFFGS